MSTLDELHVTENGDVEVRIIPPDSLSALPDVLGTYAPGSTILRTITDNLSRIEGNLGAKIQSIVHAGETRFTVVTSENEYLKVDIATNSTVKNAINKIIGLVETVELSQRDPQRNFKATTPARSNRRRAALP